MKVRNVAVPVVVATLAVSLWGDRDEKHIETRTYREVPTLSSDIFSASTLTVGYGSILFDPVTMKQL